MTTTTAPPAADTPATMNLFLRKFPRDLHKALRAAAVQNDRDLRDEVIERLRLTLAPGAKGKGRSNGP